MFEGKKNGILGTRRSSKRCMPNWRIQTLMSRGLPKPYDKNDRMVPEDKILK